MALFWWLFSAIVIRDMIWSLWGQTYITSVKLYVVLNTHCQCDWRVPLNLPRYGNSVCFELWEPTGNMLTWILNCSSGAGGLKRTTAYYSTHPFCHRNDYWIIHRYEFPEKLKPIQKQVRFVQVQVELHNSLQCEFNDWSIEVNRALFILLGRGFSENQVWWLYKKIVDVKKYSLAVMPSKICVSRMYWKEAFVISKRIVWFHKGFLFISKDCGIFTWFWNSWSVSNIQITTKLLEF